MSYPTAFKSSFKTYAQIKKLMKMNDIYNVRCVKTKGHQLMYIALFQVIKYILIKRNKCFFYFHLIIWYVGIRMVCNSATIIY